MVFHHVRGVKFFELSDPGVESMSRGAIMDEIAKCDVWCAPCHNAEHRMEAWENGAA